MKANAFPKLDRKAAARPVQGRSARGISRSDNDRISGRSLPNTISTGLATRRAAATPNKATWIAWRMKLGAGRKEALKTWHLYQQWLEQEAKQPRARFLKVAPWQDWDREFRAFLDEMPRKPFNFLARVAAAEKRRTVKASVDARKAKSRERYERQYARRSQHTRAPTNG
jgi:hypothetical protein